MQNGQNYQQTISSDILSDSTQIEEASDKP